MPVSKMYSVKEVGELLSLHPATIKAWIRSGRLEATLIGRGWRISEETLQELVKTGIQYKPRKVGRPAGGSFVPRAEVKEDAEEGGSDAQS